MPRTTPMIFAASLALGVLLTPSAYAMAPNDVDDLVGTNASRGESKLENRGYHYRKSIRVSDNTIAYWWNPHKRACIAVTTEDGRFKSIMDQPDAVCTEDDSGSGGHHGVHDLVGMRASGGEKALEDRGYQLMNSHRGNNRKWSNWWKASAHKCITVVTRDGRYDSITETAAADCGRGSYGGAAPQIRTVDGGNVSVDMGGCTVLFNRYGSVVTKGSSCSNSELRDAKDAFHSYQREQGAGAGSEAPPGGFGGGSTSGTFTCESSNGQYQFCRHSLGRHAHVTLVRRLSDSDCIQGRSWGIDTDGVWVDKGCRAVFEVR